MKPVALSDVVERVEIGCVEYWLVAYPGGSESGYLRDRVEAYMLAREVWPDLVDDE